jgi:hypothetical protein
MLKNPVVVVGDFNYPNINWTRLTGDTDFIDNTMEMYWTQNIIEPAHKSGNILDLVFSEAELI